MMKAMSDTIIITQVANGWVVHMPRPYQRDDDEEDRTDALRDSISKGMDGVMPMIKKIMAMQQEDPLLAQLRGEDEEEEPEETQSAEKPLDPVGKDRYVYVCTSFEQVLGLLRDKILGLG